MSIKKQAWVFVGILLWGIPTAVFLSCFLAVLKPGTWEAQPFQDDVFYNAATILTPIFIVFGFCFGLLMDRIGRK